MPCKRVTHVGQSPEAVVADLRRRGPNTHQLTWWLRERETPAELAREELSLVETSLSQPRAVQWHRDRPRGS